MKRLAVVVTLLLVSTVSVHAGEREKSLINSFQMLCALEPPEFKQLDQKAAAMKLPVHQDIGQSKDGGQFAHSKSWYVSLTTAPHELVVSEANGPQGYVVSCGISAQDPGGASFKAELLTSMKLGPPLSETVSSDGTTRMTVWKDVYGPGTLLQLVDASPKGKPGAMLAFFVRTIAKP